MRRTKSIGDDHQSKRQGYATALVVAWCVGIVALLVVISGGAPNEPGRELTEAAPVADDRPPSAHGTEDVLLGEGTVDGHRWLVYGRVVEPPGGGKPLTCMEIVLDGTTSGCVGVPPSEASVPPVVKWLVADQLVVVGTASAKGDLRISSASGFVWQGRTVAHRSIDTYAIVVPAALETYRFELVTVTGSVIGDDVLLGEPRAGEVRPR